MKERFGIDPQYPLSRYVDGFTKQKVPNRTSEHNATVRAGGRGRDIGAYVGTPKCTNPLFAASLPSNPGDDLCNMPQGPRGKDLVLFAVIRSAHDPVDVATPWPPAAERRARLRVDDDDARRPAGTAHQVTPSAA